ncbi:MAG: glycosyltransferase N-terminal domain-containing protein [Candidatus Hydrogenedentota bacterium]
MLLIHALYNLLLTLLVIPAAAYLAIHPKHRPLLHRFRPFIAPTLKAGAIWVHAASLGEVNTARPIVTALRERYPEASIVLTTSTVTGMAQANDLPDVDGIAWFPFDHPWSVAGFLERLKPAHLILIETELWPNVLFHARKRTTVVSLVNGRLSEKHFGGYLRAAPLLRPAIESIQLAGMQSALDAERIQRLGLRADAVHVLGNTKFDGAITQVDSAITNSLREHCGIESTASVLIFGSTRPGDEALAVECWEYLRERVTGLRLIIAPRHIQRTQEIVGQLERYSLLLRSTTKAPQTEHVEATSDERPIILLDTVGELVHFYALADVAVVGGSFSDDVQGHNPIEPAALGVATVFGPCMKNFHVPAAMLVEAEGATQVSCADDLPAQLQALFVDDDCRNVMGQHGQIAVQQNTGAIEGFLKHFDALR